MPLKCSRIILYGFTRFRLKSPQVIIRPRRRVFPSIRDIFSAVAASLRRFSSQLFFLQEPGMEQQFSPCRRSVVAPRGQLERGFTLVEVLIVISIIAILASISFAGVRIVQEKTRVAQSRTEVSQFTQSIDRYQTDEKIYPKLTEDRIYWIITMAIISSFFDIWLLAISCKLLHTKLVNYIN